MNILVDENCLWLSKKSNLALLNQAGFQLRAVGSPGCPPKKSHDPIILDWLLSNKYALLTHDFDDFNRISKNTIVIFGLISKGVFTSRADVIVKCLERCLATHGKPPPFGLYVLAQYNW